MVTIDRNDPAQRKDLRQEAWLVYSGAKNNSIFDTRSNPDGLKDKWIALRQSFAGYGIDLVTKDKSTATRQLFELHVDHQPAVEQISSPAYLILVENPHVLPANAEAGSMAAFRKIFTWDDTHVDSLRWHKYNLGQRFVQPAVDGFSHRPLFCSMIAANKALPHRTDLDLYLERQKLIQWFEINAPEDFELYGSDWDLSAMQPGLYGRIRQKVIKQFLPRGIFTFFPSWRGRIGSKQEVLSRSRYTIAYENVRDLPGYITEKIFDAFSFGCVPVYWGANNVESYIPQACFIDRRDFKDNHELHRYLKSVSENDYMAFQAAIKDFHLSQAAKQFSAQTFADTVTGVILDDLKYDRAGVVE